MNFKKKLLALFCLYFTFNLEILAQEKLITLTGIVVCEDSLTGVLSNVNIYNKNKNWGVASDKDGAFSIKMGGNDTLYFSTIQHTEQMYFINSKEKLENHNIKIYMLEDTIWLNTVNVIGLKNWKSFKQELLNLEPEKSHINFAMPIIKKYTKYEYNNKINNTSPLYNTKAKGIPLEAPLTHLYRKIILHKKRKLNPTD